MDDSIIVFIHGLGGSASGTWGKFPKLIKQDAELAKIDIGYFSFPTRIFRLPFFQRISGIQTLAQALSTQIEIRYHNRKKVILVCHSLGGLIAKQYISDRLLENKPLRVTQAIFYAVPHNGSGLADVGRFVSWWNPQIRGLCKNSDYVRSVTKNWHHSRAKDSVRSHYVVAAQDGVVEQHSSQQSWDNEDVEVVPDRGHVDVVKPESGEDLSFLILKRKIIDYTVSASIPQLTAEKKSRYQAASTKIPEKNWVDLRISVSSLLRVERDGKYLVIRNVHRPESFAPIGGVYKRFADAQEMLDRFSFQPQAVNSDMRNDLRGVIDRGAFEQFVQWMETGEGRESGEQCLLRELREELDEIGLHDVEVPAGLRFKSVRSVSEGPEFLATLGHGQYRIFDIYDIEQNEPGSAFVELLIEKASTSPDLKFVSPEASRRGRADGAVIGAHTSYLFGTTRYREGDAPFG